MPYVQKEYNNLPNEEQKNTLCVYNYMPPFHKCTQEVHKKVFTNMLDNTIIVRLIVLQLVNRFNEHTI